MALERKLVVCGEAPKAPRFYHDVGNGEFFVVRTGITYSSPTIRDYFADRCDLTDEYHFEPRLRPDVDSVSNLVTTGQSVLTEADLGSGKSTVLFGVRRLLREQGKSYIFIDGHFVNKPKPIAVAISHAKEDDIIVYDSFDYLFRNSRVSSQSSRARRMILEPLSNHVLNGGGLVATAHTEPWFSKHSTSPLRQQYQSAIAQLGLTTHKITGQLSNETEMRELAVDLSGKTFADQYLRYATGSSLPTSRTYRVMKQMSLLGIELASQEQFDGLVTSIDDTTKQKMGAPDDYQLNI